MNPTYPAYNIPSTQATWGGNPISDPSILSTQIDAEQLLVELQAIPGFPDGVTLIEWTTENNAVGGIPFIPNGETRKDWQISVPGGVSYNAGQLLAQQYANGIGSPGGWSFPSILQGPVWTSTVAGPTIPSGPTLPPGNANLPGTTTIAGFPDMPTPSAPAAGGGCGFTPAQVKEIMSVTTRLAAFLSTQGQ